MDNFRIFQVLWSSYVNGVTIHGKLSYERIRSMTILGRGNQEKWTCAQAIWGVSRAAFMKWKRLWDMRKGRLGMGILYGLFWEQCPFYIWSVYGGECLSGSRHRQHGPIIIIGRCSRFCCGRKAVLAKSKGFFHLGKVALMLMGQLKHCNLHLRHLK